MTRANVTWRRCAIRCSRPPNLLPVRQECDSFANHARVAATLRCIPSQLQCITRRCCLPARTAGTASYSLNCVLLLPQLQPCLVSQRCTCTDIALHYTEARDPGGEQVELILSSASALVTDDHKAVEICCTPRKRAPKSCAHTLSCALENSGPEKSRILNKKNRLSFLKATLVGGAPEQPCREPLSASCPTWSWVCIRTTCCRYHCTSFAARIS